MVPAGRDARRSRTKFRHPASEQLPTASPFANDGRPGTRPCRPRSVAGRGRAFGACCFAGKLRSPAGRALAALGRGGLTPTSFPTRWGGVPRPRWWSASVQLSPPRRGVERPRRVVRFARLIHRRVRVLGGPAVCGGNPQLT